VLFAQRQTVEYGSTYFDDGVFSPGGYAWKPCIVYNFGTSTVYLEKLEVAFNATENNMGWKVTQFVGTTPTLTAIGTLSGTFNYTDKNNWQTITINNTTPITGKVAFMIESPGATAIWHDLDVSNLNGDWAYYEGYGWDHNSNYGGGVNAIKATVNTAVPLPVELNSFTAKAADKKIELFWTTETEVNNYGFEVERSLAIGQQSLVKWEKIGFVQGSGDSNSPKDYSLVDENPPSGELQYRLKQIDIDGQYKYYSSIVKITSTITGFEEQKLPNGFDLKQNYPNPFNPVTTIEYSIPSNLISTAGNEALRVQLYVYDILGNKVATLVNEEQAAGNYKIVFNGSNLASGLYLYKITAGSFTSSKKLMLMK
jgi:hypothetical protein